MITAALHLIWISIGWLLLGRLGSSAAAPTQGAAAAGHAPGKKDPGQAQGNSAGAAEAWERGRQSSAASVSVIIPARNEAANLQTLLLLLQSQTLPPLEVIVVDDDSSDGTAETAAACGASVVRSGQLPPGWLGKPWASWNGAAAAAGSVLVFLDADTRPHPQLLERLADETARRGGLITVQPFHDVPTAREQASAPFNLVLLAASGWFSPLPLRRQSFGPCAACSRADYRLAGGHEAVRAEVLEHLQLGRRFRRAGLPEHGLAGEGLLAFRMYPEGLRALLRGWSKSFALGAGGTPLPGLLLTVLWLSGLLGAAAGLTGLLQPLSILERLMPLIPYALAVWQLSKLLPRAGSFRAWTWWLYPLFFGFFAAVFAVSVFQSFIRRRVRWKGRDIDVA